MKHTRIKDSDGDTSIRGLRTPRGALPERRVSTACRLIEKGAYMLVLALSSPSGKNSHNGHTSIRDSNGGNFHRRVC